MDKIMALRLINGEEIISKVKVLDGKYILSKPASIVIQQSATGKAQMGLVDYLPLADKKEATLEVSSIMFEYEPANDVANAYNQKFGSGLVTPSKSILTI